MIIKPKKIGNAKDNPNKLLNISINLQQKISVINETLKVIELNLHQLDSQIDKLLKLKKSVDDDDILKQIKQLKSLQNENNDIYLKYQKNYQEFVNTFDTFNKYYKNHYLVTINKHSI